MINFSLSSKKFFKINFESKDEFELTNVREENNVLFTSISPLVTHKDTIKIIHQDGYEEVRKVKQSIPHTFVGRQKIILL